MWLGGVIGILLPCIDHLLYIYLFRPYELTSQRAKSLLAQKRLKDAVLLLYDTGDERFGPIFHSAFFQIVFLFLTFLILTSSTNIIGKGVVLGVSLHLLVDQLEELLEKGNLDSWFRENSFFAAINLAKEKALVYWMVILLAVLIIGFFV
jgi:hypothetical protein